MLELTFSEFAVNLFFMDRSGDIRNGRLSPKWRRRLLVIAILGLIISGFWSFLLQIAEHSYGLKAWFETCLPCAMALNSYIVYRRIKKEKSNV